MRGNDIDGANGSEVNGGDKGSMHDVLDNLMQYTSAMNSGPEDDDDGDSGVGRDGEEHKVKAEAKSNRKVFICQKASHKIHTESNIVLLFFSLFSDCRP